MKEIFGIFDLIFLNRVRIILMLFCLLTSSLQCRSYHQDEQRALYNALRSHKAAAILLYARQQKKSRGSSSYQKCVSLQQAYTALARSGFYPRKALFWASIDINSPVGKQFVQDYGVVIDRFPALVLVRDGVLVRDQHGIVTAGPDATRAQVKQMIDDYLQIDIAQYVQEERLCKQYERVVRDRVHLYYCSYFDRVANPWNDYWGWPYYGMAQGNYGGNAGVNVGNRGVNFFGSNY